MKVGVFGSGYVGLVTAACLAEVGHQVVCTDVDEERIAQLRQGRVPFHEPLLAPLVRAGLEAGLLRFSASAAEAAGHGEVQCIAVGTPSAADGSADTSQVLDAAGAIGRAMDGYRLLLIRSTVPVGTGDAVEARLRGELAHRGEDLAHDVVANPEFLQEGSAVEDFQRPCRILLGTRSPRAIELLRRLYAPFNGEEDRVVCMDRRSAELAKYTANAMLATRISFMNEIAALAECTGADIEDVRHAVGMDPRIGQRYLRAGCGWGGSCLPKDLRALRHAGAACGLDMALIGAVQAVNERQKRKPAELLAVAFGGEAGLRDKRVALWGLSFKPGTSDLREAPSRTLVAALGRAGAQVRAFDPAAMPDFERLEPLPEGCSCAPDMYSALDGADALVVCTEWPQFQAPDFEAMKRRMRRHVIVDGRNLYAPAALREAGWRYFGVGRA